jgi:probable rRNA maturation factor
MKLNIYNWEILKKSFSEFPFSKKDIKESLLKNFSVYNISELGIIFVSEEYIKDLNKQYRDKDSVTDVLSFVVDEKPLVGEVYICPEFVKASYNSEEIVRDMAHGILHVTGEDHTLEFTLENLSKEKMFVKQEDILQNILNEISSRSGQSRKNIS